MKTLNLMTTRIMAPPDPDDGSCEGLLAVVIAVGDAYEPPDHGTHFLTEPTLPLQAAALSHKTGDRIEPHYHPPHERTVTGTPEVLIVVDGSYLMTVFTTRGVEAASVTLAAGTLVVIVSGGHGFVALEDDSSMFEVKVGPYLGGADKVYYSGRCG